MPDFRDEYFQSIVYIVDDAVVSDAEAARSASLELPVLSRTRVFGEIFYGPHYRSYTAWGRRATALRARRSTRTS